MTATRFQSTLPQGERPFKSLDFSSHFSFQSTLPQGERLSDVALGVPIIAISIHAPTRGATYTASLPPPPPSDFNPRSHKGSDLYIFLTVPVLRRISIHAPTRGATTRNGLTMKAVIFQSTLPQGERQERNVAEFNIYDNFNPRSHKGSDDRG